MKYFASLLAALLLGSTVTYAQSPVAFNDKMVFISDTLFVKGQQWGKKLNEIVETKDYKKLSSMRSDLDQYVAAKIVEVSMMKDVGGSEDYRKAMLKYLLFEKEMIADGFKPFEELPATATPPQITLLVQNLQELGQKENEALQLVKLAQEEYAKKNGIKIEGNPEN